VAARQWNGHTTDAAILIYVDRVTKALLEHLRHLADQKRNVFVYAWAPGQIVQEFAGRDIEVKPVHETLVKRFQ
jgi:adenine-specific DNA-methyltransferase